MKDTIICQKSDLVTLRTARTKKALKYETKYKRNYVDRSIYQDLSKVTDSTIANRGSEKSEAPSPALIIDFLSPRAIHEQHNNSFFNRS